MDTKQQTAFEMCSAYLLEKIGSTTEQITGNDNIFERNSSVLNSIMHMLQQDPIAKQLLQEAQNEKTHAQNHLHALKDELFQAPEELTRKANMSSEDIANYNATAIADGLAKHWAISEPQTISKTRTVKTPDTTINDIGEIITGKSFRHATDSEMQVYEKETEIGPKIINPASTKKTNYTKTIGVIETFSDLINDVVKRGTELGVSSEILNKANSATIIIQDNSKKCEAQPGEFTY